MERFAVNTEENHPKGTIELIEESQWQERRISSRTTGRFGARQNSIKMMLKADESNSRPTELPQRSNTTPPVESHWKGLETANLCLLSTRSNKLVSAGNYYNSASSDYRKQLSTGRAKVGQRNSAAIRVNASMLLQICLVLFVLSLFSSTTTNLVNGKCSLARPRCMTTV